jgi:hypothetical protein
MKHDDQHTTNTTHNAGFPPAPGKAHPKAGEQSEMQISNIHKNVMGTLSFTAQFQSMRKPQDFIIYAIGANDTSQVITIQSDTRIGRIDLVTGNVILSKSIARGAYFSDLAYAHMVGTFGGEDLLLLKAKVLSTASSQAGTRGVTCDNAGAVNVFGSDRSEQGDSK